MHGPDCDITVIIRVLDDEDRVGHVVRRLVRHLRALERSFEVLVADEGSGDNTLAVIALLRQEVRELSVVHANPERGFVVAGGVARGRSVLFYDVRSVAPLGALGFALGRLADGIDVVTVGGRYLVCRRTRSWKAFEALEGETFAEVERRFIKRARSLGLVCEQTPARRPSGAWARARALVRLWSRPSHS